MLAPIKRIRIRMSVASSSQNTPQDLERVTLLFDETNIDLDRALSGYIRVMKKKHFVSDEIEKSLLKYIKEIEDEFKFKLQVTTIDYDSLSDDACPVLSSNDDDDPNYGNIGPAAKRKRTEDEKIIAFMLKPAKDSLRGPAVESFFNNLEKKIRKLVFHRDTQNRSLRHNEDEMGRKYILLKIMQLSKLLKDDITDVMNDVVALAPARGNDS